MSTAKPIPGIDVRHRKSCPGPRADGALLQARPTALRSYDQPRAAKKSPPHVPDARRRQALAAGRDCRRPQRALPASPAHRHRPPGRPSKWLADCGARRRHQPQSGDQLQAQRACASYRHSLAPARPRRSRRSSSSRPVTRGDLQRLARPARRRTSLARIDRPSAPLLPLRATYRRAISLRRADGPNPTTGPRAPRHPRRPRAGS